MSNEVRYVFPAHVMKNILDLSKGEKHTLPDGRIATMVDVGDWVDDGRYSLQTIVFEIDGRFYEYTRSRTGSYFSDYHYETSDWKHDEPITCFEVKRVTKMVEVWENVKNEDVTKEDK